MMEEDKQSEHKKTLGRNILLGRMQFIAWLNGEIGKDEITEDYE